jgi:hypothetical protein
LTSVFERLTLSCDDAVLKPTGVIVTCMYQGEPHAPRRTCLGAPRSQRQYYQHPIQGQLEAQLPASSLCSTQPHHPTQHAISRLPTMNVSGSPQGGFLH